jgi:hypothetical protein
VELAVKAREAIAVEGASAMQTSPSVAQITAALLKMMLAVEPRAIARHLSDATNGTVTMYTSASLVVQTHHATCISVMVQR